MYSIDKIKINLHCLILILKKKMNLTEKRLYRIIVVIGIDGIYIEPFESHSSGVHSFCIWCGMVDGGGMNAFSFVLLINANLYNVLITERLI